MGPIHRFKYPVNILLPPQKIQHVHSDSMQKVRKADVQNTSRISRTAGAHSRIPSDKQETRAFLVQEQQRLGRESLKERRLDQLTMLREGQRRKRHSGNLTPKWNADASLGRAVNKDA